MVTITAGTLMVMTTVMMGVIRTEKCPKLDPELWDYMFCPHPESEEWHNLKIKMNCNGDSVYHCASNSQGCDVQLCVKRVYCAAGNHPLLDPDKDTAICAPCPPDRYQRTGFWSNEQSYCEHEKTKCDGDGQIECQPGSATTDRSCRCNIHQNLALESYALHNATCCTNNDPWCYCINFISPCPNGTVRHDNYKCLEECPPNSFRHWDSETCYPNSTTVKVEMTTSTVKNITEFNQMTTTTHPMSTSSGSPDTVVVGVVVGLIIAGILVGLAVGLWVWHRRKKRNNGPRNDEEQAGPLQDLMTDKGQVIVYKKCKFVNNNNTTTKVHGGKGYTINLGEKNRTWTTINENCAMGSEDSDSLESMESSNGRNSAGGENPENQSNPHRPGHNVPQQHKTFSVVSKSNPSLKMKPEFTIKGEVEMKWDCKFFSGVIVKISDNEVLLKKFAKRACESVVKSFKPKYEDEIPDDMLELHMSNNAKDLPASRKRKRKEMEKLRDSKTQKEAGSEVVRKKKEKVTPSSLKAEKQKMVAFAVSKTSQEMLQRVLIDQFSSPSTVGSDSLEDTPLTETWRVIQQDINKTTYPERTKLPEYVTAWCSKCGITNPSMTDLNDAGTETVSYSRRKYRQNLMSVESQ